MLFFKGSVNGIFVAENEVELEEILGHIILLLLLTAPKSNGKNREAYLDIIATFVRAEHNSVRSLVMEIIEIKVLGVGQQLNVGTTTVHPILKIHFILNIQRLIIEFKTTIQLGRNCRMLGFRPENQAPIILEYRSFRQVKIPMAIVFEYIILLFLLSSRDDPPLLGLIKIIKMLCKVRLLAQHWCRVFYLKLWLTVLYQLLAKENLMLSSLSLNFPEKSVQSCSN